MSDTFARHPGLVYHVSDTDCRPQTAGTHGPVFATFSCRFFNKEDEKSIAKLMPTPPPPLSLLLGNTVLKLRLFLPLMLLFNLRKHVVSLSLSLLLGNHVLKLCLSSSHTSF